MAMSKTIEGIMRSYLATKKQTEVLQLRADIATEVKTHVADTLESWGYHLLDVQVNDIAFDNAVTHAMNSVVASAQALVAAKNNGEAQKLSATMKAEAEGRAIIITAESEKTASIVRGEGIAGFRRAMAEGMKEAELLLGNGQDAANMLMFAMYVEALQTIAREGKGNILTFDGSVDGMRNALLQMKQLNNPV